MGPGKTPIRLALLTVLVSLSGCTLITQVEATECRNHRTCDVLNDLGESDGEIEVDTCHRWQCSGIIVVEEFDANADPLDVLLNAGTCVLQPQDLDSDGFVSDLCEGAGEGGIDCFDLNAATNPSADEICDGRDNNCNGVIDEGVLPDVPENPVVVDGLPSFRNVSAARNGDGLSLVFASVDGLRQLHSATGFQPLPLQPFTQEIRTDFSQTRALKFLAMESAPGCWGWRRVHQMEAICAGAGVMCGAAGTIVERCANSYAELDRGPVCLPMARSGAGGCGFDSVWTAALGGSLIVAATQSDNGVLRMGAVSGETLDLVGPTRRSSLFGGVDLGLENDFQPPDVTDLVVAGGDTTGLAAWTGDHASCQAVPVHYLPLLQARNAAVGSWLTAANEGRATFLQDGFALAAIAEEDGFILAVASTDTVFLYRFEPPPVSMLGAVSTWGTEPYQHAPVQAPPAPTVIEELQVAGVTDLALSSDDAGGLVVVARTGCTDAPHEIWSAVVEADRSSSTPQRLASGALSSPDVIYNAARSEWVLAWMQDAPSAHAELVSTRVDHQGEALAQASIGVPRGYQAFTYQEGDVIRAAVVRGRNDVELANYSLTCASD